MATATKLTLRQMLQRLGGVAEADDDGQLLARFRNGDEAAFSCLVERHGPMVLATCRRVLGREHDAEDAFQATFLVLARKAGSLDGSRSLAAWLHTVAQRLAFDARKQEQRRLRREQRVSSDGVAWPDEIADGQEASNVVDAELTKLPLKYRAPLVLCYLEGKSHEEAAHVLGWPRGSMAKRLARGQEILKQRLVRRGVSLALATSCIDGLESRAAVTPGQVASITQAAQTFVSGRMAATPAELLAQGALRNMLVNKMKQGTLAGVALACILGAGWWLNQAVAQPEAAAQPAPAKAPAQASVESVKKTVDGGNLFAGELFQKLRGEPGNLFFSPYSVSTALAMTSAGARGTTDAEMVKTLHLIPEQEQRHPAFAELIRQTRRDKKDKVQLHVANALWGQDDFPFHDDFLGTTASNYGAGLRKLDFAKTEDARQTINRWVEENTNDKIKDLIPKGVLDPVYTKLVLTNAIYFKGDWASQFKKELTSDGPFFTAPDKQVQARLMYQTQEFKFFEDGNLQALELPYVGNNMAMIALLPKKKDGLDQLEAGFSMKQLEEILGKMHKTKVNVVLPCFKMTSKFALSKRLKEMGMPSAFGAADLSGMTGGPNKLYISEVIHQGFVEVNEEGTEAAGATAVVIKERRAVGPIIPSFRADHPFLFLIRDNTTGSILFVGRLADPSK
ncbi:MAG: sigma-70 family RNA polymerase sigma factor [Gemmataceae bacterium]